MTLRKRGHLRQSLFSIGIDGILHRPCGGGVERAIEGAVRGFVAARLSLKLDLFISDSLAQALVGLTGNGGPEIHEIRYSSRVERILKEQILVFKCRRIRLWHFLGYVSPFLVPRSRVVVSIYDIIALTHPDLCTGLNRSFYGFMLPGTIRRADCIVVPSNHVKRRIEERFPGIEPKIRVMPLPLMGHINDARVTESGLSLENGVAGADKNYLLFVGDLGPKKNISFLLRSYALVPAEIRAKYRLRICGRYRGHVEKHRRLAAELGIEKQVDFTGYVPDKDLPAVYRNAKLLLYPSLEEGYGYPPLEAMALGTPAVVSDRGALPGVAGEAGAIVSALEQEEFSGAVVRLLTDSALYCKTQQRGRSSVLRTTWVDYAHEMAKIYEELL